MNGIIVGNDVVVKPGGIPQFYKDCPWQHKPTMLHQYVDHYTYRYVTGRQATIEDIPAILAYMGEIWDVPNYPVYLSQAEKESYIDYISQLRQQHLKPFEAMCVIDAALCIILDARLPVADTVHGDLTLENVVIVEPGSEDSRYKDIVFIDPNDNQRVVTPAYDRGKLLQSYLMRWEARTGFDENGNPNFYGIRPWKWPRPWPEWANIVDWAFLVTHWVRLLRHWPNLDIQSGFQTLEAQLLYASGKQLETLAHDIR